MKRAQRLTSYVCLLIYTITVVSTTTSTCLSTVTAAGTLSIFIIDTTFKNGVVSYFIYISIVVCSGYVTSEHFLAVQKSAGN